MKTIIKKQIRFAIAIVIAFSFIVPVTAVAGETLLLASLDRSTPDDKLDNYDFFPDHHREARIKEELEKARINRAQEDTVDSLITDAAWVGGKVIIPVHVIAGNSGEVTDKVIIPYEMISGDYVALIERVLVKYGPFMAETVDAMFSMKF